MPGPLPFKFPGFRNVELSALLDGISHVVHLVRIDKTRNGSRYRIGSQI